MFIQTVALRDVKFYAFHGFYPEEQLIGNHFLVDAVVTFVPSGETEDISATVNYEIINEVISAEMKQTQKLLETVVKNILNSLNAKYPHLRSAKVGITKLNPIMKGEVGSSFVELSYIAQH